MDLIASGYINSNKIEFSERLEEQFMRNWKLYVRKDSIFRPIAGTPFWHLHYEPFWKLVPYEGGDEAIAMWLQGNPYAPSTTRKHIRYAEIDQALFDLLQDKTNRARLRTTLIKHYL
jgi:predicted restriction endonuclease